MQLFQRFITVLQAIIEPYFHRVQAVIVYEEIAIGVCGIHITKIHIEIFDLH